MSDGVCRQAIARLHGAAALLAAGVLGLALQLQQRSLWPLSAYVLLLIMALGVCGAGLVRARRAPQARLRRQALSALVLWCAVMVAAFAWPGVRAAWEARHQMPADWHGLDVRVVGVVVTMPRWQADGVRFRFQPEQASLVSGEPLALTQRMDIAWYAHNRFARDAPWNTAAMSEAQARRATQARLPALHAGDRLAFTVRLRTPSGLFNPPLFDYEQWLWQQGVQATGYVRADDAHAAPALLGDSGRYRLERLRQAVRDRIVARLQTDDPDALRERSAGVLAALVTGDQRAIEQSDWEVFRITGVAHLMAISGLHITMFASLAIGVVGWVWRRSASWMLILPAPLAALWGGLLLATAYAVFSGWQVPAQRTVLMLATWVLVRSLGLRWPWHATLMLAAALVLVLDPWALQQAGFWLSFVAVAVLLVLSDQPDRPREAGAMDRRSSPGARAWQYARLGMDKSRAGASQLWRLQWRLSLVLAPLTIALFGQISWVGLLANLVAIPIVTVLITPLAMLGALLPGLLPLAAWCMEGLLALLQWLAGWPYADARWPLVPWGWALCGWVGAVLLVGRWPGWLRLQGALCVVAMLVWRPAVPPAGEFVLTALDVGQGAAVLVQTRHHVLVYDAGPRYNAWRDAGRSVVVPYLQARGLRPDALMLSHSDSDHTGGAGAVLQAFPELPVYAPFDGREWQQRIATSMQQQALAGSGRPLLHRCEHGLRWEWDGVQFAVLYPEAAMLDRWFHASHATGVLPVPTNATSCVLQVRSSTGRVAMLTGDIGRLEEQHLRLSHGDALRADWLLVPHHGSRSSSTAAFIQLVAPRHAVVQAGFRNTFGHPHPDVVRRFEQSGVVVWQTPDCGAIRWVSSLPDAVECTREVHKRIWHRVNPR